MVSIHHSQPHMVSHGVPMLRSQRVGSRSVSLSTDALDSDQARHTTQRILQHTRSLPTNSPVPYIPSTDREYRSDSGLSDRYTVRTPMATGVDRSAYVGYMTEHDDYATLGSITPTSLSIGMFVKPRTKSISSHGSLMPKGNANVERAASTSSHPIIGEITAVFLDMIDTTLKVLDRRVAVMAQARDFENSLVENVYTIGQNRQSMTGYLPDPDMCQSLPSQPFYMNTMPRTTDVGIPMAESNPVPHRSDTL